MLFRSSLGSQVNVKPDGSVKNISLEAMSLLKAGDDGRMVGVREEIMLAGAHSDIGGGYLGPGSAEPDGDLSDIALWILAERAERAGVVLGDLPSVLRRVDMPVVHENTGQTSAEVEGLAGRQVLVNGKPVNDELAGIYGVSPTKPWNNRWGAPELEEIGLRYIGGKDDPVVNAPGRVPEQSEGLFVRSLDVGRYCEFLISRRIIVSEKYLGYCKG